MENEIKFEKALGELEKIVADLESGELGLDDALKRYEEGIKLSRACAKKLGEAEKKIETLTSALNNLSEEAPEETASKKSEKKKSKKNSSDDEFML